MIPDLYPRLHTPNLDKPNLDIVQMTCCLHMSQNGVALGDFDVNKGLSLCITEMRTLLCCNNKESTSILTFGKTTAQLTSQEWPDICTCGIVRVH